MGLGGGGGLKGGGGETVWLCKICGEEREMWRKSGAWFFKVGRRAQSCLSPALCTYCLNNQMPALNMLLHSVA